MKRLFTAAVNKIKDLLSIPEVGRVVPVQEKVEISPEFPVKKAPAKKKATPAKKAAILTKKTPAKKTTAKKSK